MANKIYAAAHAICLFSEDGKYRPPYYKSILVDSIMKNDKKTTLAHTFTNKLYNGPYYDLRRFFTFLRKNNYGRWVTPEPRTIDLNAFDFRPYVNMNGGDQLIIDDGYTLYPTADYFIRAYIRDNLPFLIDLPYSYETELPEPSSGGNVIIGTTVGSYSVWIPAYDPNEQYLFLYYQSINNSPQHKSYDTSYATVTDFVDPGLDFVLVSSSLVTEEIPLSNSTYTLKKYTNEDLDEVPETDVTDASYSFDNVKEVWVKIEEIKDNKENIIDTLTTTITHTSNFYLNTTNDVKEITGVDIIDGAREPYTATITTSTTNVIEVRNVQVEKEVITSRSVSNKSTLTYKRNSGTPGLDVLFGDRERTGFIPKFIQLKRDGWYFIPQNSGWDSIANLNKLATKRWFKRDSVYSDLIQEIGKDDGKDIANMSLFPCIDIGRNEKPILVYMFHATKYLIEKYNVGVDEPFEQSVHSYRVKNPIGVKPDFEDREARIDLSNICRTEKYGFGDTIRYTDGDFSITGDNISYAFPIKFVKYHIGNGKYSHNGRTLKVGDIVRVPASTMVAQGFNMPIYTQEDSGRYRLDFRAVYGVVKVKDNLLAGPWNVSQSRGPFFAENAWSLVRQVSENRWERVEAWFGGVPLVRLNWMLDGLEMQPPMASQGVRGFVMPIIEDVFNRVPLKYSNDLSQYSPFVIAHSWVKVKKKWYQSTIFKVVIIVIAIVLAIWTGGSSLSAAGGILGTNAAVGAAIGLTGMAATLVGAVINTVAAMIVANIITKIATKALGPILGQIISLVAMMVLTNAKYGDGGINFNFAETFSSMMDVSTLLKMTIAAGNGLTDAINAKTVATSKSMQADIDALNKASSDALNMLNELNSNSMFTAQELIENTQSPNVMSLESSSSFINRTLATASDIIEMQLAMITDYVDINTQLVVDINPVMDE